MEKRKVYKISIIDREISRTEFDRNTFYTSDSELTLVFKLIERDYTYDHGEILLYNENDKSFVTRQIEKQENDFVYEIDSDIIPHYGKWKVQLQLIKDGDIYTSKPFEFTIENDLSNLAPQPTLTDINNWSTLKQSANELIDEMQDIIVDVEKAEFERANKENYREQAESERVNQERTRQNSELKRYNQENKRQKEELERENNEKKRRIAEFERVDKESTRQQAEQVRQSLFDTNERERQSLFDTNERERQSLFDTNERERHSDELIRVENENQRKIDHANRNAELDSKANKKQEDWITPMLINGWVATDNKAYPIGFYKDTLGIVRLRGRIQSGTSSTAFQLPVGYRPSSTLSSYPASVSNTSAIVNVTITAIGNVNVGNIASIPSGQAVYLDGVSFRSV